MRPFATLIFAMLVTAPLAFVPTAAAEHVTQCTAQGGTSCQIQCLAGSRVRVSVAGVPAIGAGSVSCGSATASCSLSALSPTCTDKSSSTAGGTGWHTGTCQSNAGSVVTCQRA